MFKKFRLRKLKLKRGFSSEDFYNPFFFCDFLIEYIKDITTDQNKVACINKPQFLSDSLIIIQGLLIRKRIINRLRVYEESFFSKQYGIQPLSDHLKLLHDKCIYLIDKYFYLFTFKN